MGRVSQTSSTDNVEEVVEVVEHRTLRNWRTAQPLHYTQPLYGHAQGERLESTATRARRTRSVAHGACTPAKTSDREEPKDEDTHGSTATQGQPRASGTTECAPTVTAVPPHMRVRQQSRPQRRRVLAGRTPTRTRLLGLPARQAHGSPALRG